MSDATHPVVATTNKDGSPSTAICPVCKQTLGVLDKGVAAEPLRFVLARHSFVNPEGRHVCSGSHGLVPATPPITAPITTDEFGLRYQDAMGAVDRLYQLIKEVNSVTQKLAEANLDVRYEIVETQRLGRPISVRLLSPRVSQLIRPPKGAATIVFIYECGCTLQTKEERCPHHGAPFVVERQLGD